jgi:transposase
LGRSDLQPTKIKRRKRKLDWQALEKDVKENPDARLIDRAKKFGTRPSAICYALKEMKITRKKKNGVTRRETEKKELNTTLISEN